MSSRLNLVTPAVRPKLLARIMISGPSGSGKTWAALTIARSLVDGDMSKILVIDTEKESALTYAENFRDPKSGLTFNHLPWDPPYNPGELGDTLVEAGSKMPRGVLIVDSLTHFWKGEGGTLQIADSKYTGWAGARVQQLNMVNGILASECHTIVCVRSKVAYSQEEDPTRQGKFKVVRLGMAPEQDATLEYEMNVALELDIEHNAYVSKSRADQIPVNRQYVPGTTVTFAEEYKDWLDGGTELDGLSREALQTRINDLDQTVKDKLQEKWVERSMPKLAVMQPSQILRAAALLDQIERDLSTSGQPVDNGTPMALEAQPQESEYMK